MLTIKDKKIFSDNGSLLKVNDCPRRVSGSDLTQTSDHVFHCNKYEKQVFATEFLTEAGIVELITDKPESCLKISRFDPRFRFDT